MPDPFDSLVGTACASTSPLTRGLSDTRVRAEHSSRPFFRASGHCSVTYNFAFHGTPKYFLAFDFVARTHAHASYNTVISARRVPDSPRPSQSVASRGLYLPRLPLISISPVSNPQARRLGHTGVSLLSSRAGRPVASEEAGSYWGVAGGFVGRMGREMHRSVAFRQPSECDGIELEELDLGSLLPFAGTWQCHPVVYCHGHPGPVTPAMSAPLYRGCGRRDRIASMVMLGCSAATELQYIPQGLENTRVACRRSPPATAKPYAVSLGVVYGDISFTGPPYAFRRAHAWLARSIRAGTLELNMHRTIQLDVRT